MPNQGFGRASYKERRSSPGVRAGKIAMIAISRDRKTGIAVIGLALALAVIGQLLLDYRAAVPVAAGLCLLAVVLAALPRPCATEEAEARARRPWNRREVAALALLLAFALAIRLLANGQYPIGVSY